MRRLTLAGLVAAFLAAGIASAHGGLEHVLGTVTSISDKAITIQTAGKPSRTVTYALAADTKFEKSGVAATLKDLKVSDRVALEIAETKGQRSTVKEVRFGTPPPAKRDGRE